VGIEVWSASKRRGRRNADRRAYSCRRGKIEAPFFDRTDALSKETDSQGGHTYEVRAPIVLKPTHDGQRAGEVQLRKEFADRARIRILSDRVDGQPQQSGWACYEIPLNKFLNKAPAAAPSLAAPPATKATK